MADQSVADVVSQALSAVESARGQTDPDDFLPNFVQRTRNLFRRRRRRRRQQESGVAVSNRDNSNNNNNNPQAGSGTTDDLDDRPVNTCKRGRKQGATCSIYIFLLAKANEDYVPPNSELRRLQRNELGHPRQELPDLMERDFKKSVLRRDLTLEELDDYIVAGYPNVPLRHIGYHYAVSDKGRRLQKLPSDAVFQTLLKEIGSGKLYLIPKRDIQLPLQVSNQPITGQGPPITAATQMTRQSVDMVEETPPISTPPVQLCRCGRTLQHNQCLVCEQDDEYNQSLQADIEKSQGNTVSTDVNLEELRATRAANVPEEPSSSRGIGIIFRFPDCNRQVCRRFELSTKLKFIMNFVGGQQDAPEAFGILFAGSRKKHMSCCCPGESSISELGVTGPTVTHVVWGDSDHSCEFQTTETSVSYVDADTPTVSFRLRRQAAQVARVQIQEWVGGNPGHTPPPRSPTPPRSHTPQRSSTPPRLPTPPPRSSTPPPRSSTPPPRSSTPPPRSPTTPPRSPTPPPRSPTTPPRSSTPPPRSSTPPPRSPTPPPRSPTTPPRSPTPPPRSPTTPPRSPTPPPRSPTTPPRSPTPPPRSPTTPPRSSTPPPRSSTPPPRSSTPPPRSSTPPPRSPTPPPRSPTTPPRSPTPPPRSPTTPPRSPTPPPRSPTTPPRSPTPPPRSSISPTRSLLSPDEDTPNDMTVEAIIEQLQNRLKDDPAPLANMLNVVRGNVLDGAFRAFKRTKFDPWASLSVVFMDESGTSEGAVDGGGPTREFLRLGLEELRTGRLFTGPDFQKLLDVNARDIEKQSYFFAGLLIGVSISHGGPAPHFFSPLLFDQLTENKFSPCLDLVYNEEIKSQLTKIKTASTVEEAREEAIKCDTLLAMCGTQRYIRSLGDRDRLVNDTLQFYLHHRVRTPLEQLRGGLEKAGILDVIMLHPQSTVQLFTKLETELSAQDLMNLFLPCHSPRGHIKFQKEATVVGFWRDWLLEIEETHEPVTLEDVLIFFTGSSRIPYLGFQITPNLHFLHAEDCPFGIKYPSANTCALTLSLPVYSSFDVFRLAMEDGIRQSPGFGQA